MSANNPSVTPFHSIANDAQLEAGTFGVRRELLRQTNSKTTLDQCAKAVTPSKRQAHERIVNQLLAAQQRTSEPSHLQLAGSEK